METKNNKSGTSVHIDHETLLRLRAWYNRNYRKSKCAPPQSCGFQTRVALSQFLASEEQKDGITWIAGVTNE
ncbi:hypothetical protein V6239_24110 [Vibrio alginolyticus]|uniref:hypothetical protein n=1 Tax=Vibrio harveyi group TaxID=717610 RepID=UPI001A208A54|nr:hypothetical protein [Vibrio parahaemolyticus]EHR5466255.1 hypothetical protein [Vibrio parahaemolyticus]EKB1992584.1 hypothetical protein [Vibrio parahaemolyticus]EME0136070.1 hypothetical protein [Vibrio parahaemolyticus]MCZ6023682.1 hypothetical protein [Vibrio parahaemolyticus]HAS6882912.1 hypothetical protein [Vibrio parahaemolyticus]